MLKPEGYEQNVLENLQTGLLDIRGVDKAFVASTDLTNVLPNPQNFKTAYGLEIGIIVDEAVAEHRTAYGDIRDAIKRHVPGDDSLPNTFGKEFYTSKNNRVSAAAYLGNITMHPQDQRWDYVPAESPLRQLAAELSEQLGSLATLDDLEYALVDMVTRGPVLQTSGMALMVGGTRNNQWTSLLPEYSTGFERHVPIDGRSYTSEHIAYLLYKVASPGMRLLTLPHPTKQNA